MVRILDDTYLGKQEVILICSHVATGLSFINEDLSRDTRKWLPICHIRKVNLAAVAICIFHLQRAARVGAPQAQQIADRFHLQHNLVKAIEPLVAHCLTAIRHLQREEAHREESCPTGSHVNYEPTRLARLAYNQARFDQVMELHGQHLTSADIAQRLGMTARTVRRWIARGVCPDEQRRRKRWRPLNQHEDYVHQRWTQGCHDVSVLWLELRQRGFSGTHRTVYRYTHTLHQGTGGAPVGKDLQIRRIVWFIVQPPDALTLEQQAVWETLRRVSPTLDKLYGLVQSFGQMVRQREGYRLDAWLQLVAESRLTEVQRFAVSLLKDKEAVVAGLTERYSNGMVEGFVNKLKCIKRVMYGQAGFALLRQRILHAA